MINELYQKVLENELGRAGYLLLLMIVGTWQILKQAKLEILAEALPILFESRRKKLKRFLKLEILNIKKIWFLCLKEMLKQQQRFTTKGLVYIAIDRTSWGAINLLIVSLIYDKRAIPIYWKILDKKGSSNLEEQQRVLGKILTVLSGHKIVVLGDREWEHPNYVMSINAQKGKKAFVITILVPITQFREPLKIYELPKRLAI